MVAQPEANADLERYSDQARQAMAEKKWPEAVKALESLGKLAPSSAEVQANLGMALYFEGRPAEAVAAFERALKLNPKLPQGRLMIGICYVDLGRNEEAARLLAPAFQHPPDRETGRLAGLSLQRAYADLRRYNDSLAVSEELLKRYPDDPEILFQTSRVYTDRSYQLMSQLVRQAPDSAWVHFANGQVQESTGHYDLAQQEYRTVLRLMPELPRVHYRLGRAILAASREPRALEEASREFQQELAIASRNADAEYEIAEIYRERGEYDLALQHFSRAVEFHPEFSEAQIGLARTLLKLGKPAEAARHLEQAVRLDPENKVPHFLLGSAYRASGDSAGAAREFAAYKKLRNTASDAGIRAAGAPGATQQTIGPESPADP